MAPTKKPTAFVVPSIIVDPGTPHFSKKSPFVNKKSDEDIIIKSRNDITDGSSDTDQTDNSIDKSPPLITFQKVPKFEIHDEETDEKNEIGNEIENENANEIHIGKDLFNWSHNPSHSILYPGVLKIKTIIVDKYFFLQKCHLFNIYKFTNPFLTTLQL